MLRRRQIFALCSAAGALIAAAITPGVIGPDFAPALVSRVPPGFIIDREIRDNSGPMPSIIGYAHKFDSLEPGDPGYVPEPKPGEPGYEPLGAASRTSSGTPSAWACKKLSLLVFSSRRRTR